VLFVTWDSFVFGTWDFLFLFCYWISFCIWYLVSFVVGFPLFLCVLGISWWGVYTNPDDSGSDTAEKRVRFRLKRGL